MKFSIQFLEKDYSSSEGNISLSNSALSLSLHRRGGRRETVITPGEFKYSLWHSIIYSKSRFNF